MIKARIFPSRVLLEPLEVRVLLTVSLPPGFVDTTITDQLIDPTAMAFAPTINGNTQLFVTEQTGALRIIKNGTLLPTPFVTLPVDSTVERGLVGVAIDPNYATNHFVYVYYTATTPVTHNRISRFVADGDVAAGGLAGETVLFDLDPVSAGNHNGGALNFGSDGKLYAAVGDNAVSENAQSLATVKGKMLRLNPDGTIPTDNPFYTQTTGNNRAIWALGLRNPYSFAVQPGTGTLYINDVGENTWEEIDVGAAGANYGWPMREGNFPHPSSLPDIPGAIPPLFAYDHSNGQIAITGGTFYNPPQVAFPGNYLGSYFFADFGAGWIHRLNAAHVEADFATGGTGIVGLTVDSQGALYYIEHYTGKLQKITFPTSSVIPFTAPAVASDFVLNVDAGPSTPHRFTLNYDPALDVATLAQPGAVQVSQRAGALRANATLVSINAAAHSSLWQVSDPAGWVPGRYTISTPDGIVKDTNGSPVGARTITDFFVDTDANPFFRERWYEQANPDVAAAGANQQYLGYAHFVASGAKEGRSPSPLFDETWYRLQNPDVAAAIAKGGPGAPHSAYEHYITAGYKEGRAPNPFFDEKYYLAHYADAAAYVRALPGKSGYEYFLRAGAALGESPSIYFDTAYYLSSHPGLAAPGTSNSGTARSAFEAFLFYGLPKGDAPNPFYNERDYLALNPDVAAAVSAGRFSSGLQHFALAGRDEGRRPSAFFDPAYYAAQNPDVAAAVNAHLLPSYYDHFLLAGIHEQRAANPLFDPTFYLTTYPDIAAAALNGNILSPFYHFAARGALEGRNPSAQFDAAFYLQNNPLVATALANHDFDTPFEHYVIVGQGMGLQAHA